MGDLGLNWTSTYSCIVRTDQNPDYVKDLLQLGRVEVGVLVLADRAAEKAIKILHRGQNTTELLFVGTALCLDSLFKSDAFSLLLLIQSLRLQVSSFLARRS